MIKPGRGFFILTKDTRILYEKGCGTEAAKLKSYLEPATGYDIQSQPLVTGAANTITLKINTKLASMGSEDYPTFRDIPYLISTTPGAQLQLDFSGPAIGLWGVAGSDAGIIEYSIDAGPWQQQDLFTAWSASVQLPWAYILDAELAAGKHRVVLRVSSRKNSHSKGTAVRIAYFLEN